MAIFRAYFDESGTNEDSDIAVMAGFVANVDKWGEFKERWPKLLDKYKLPKIFHSKKYFFRRRGYEHLNNEEYAAFSDEVIETMANYTAWNIFIPVSKKIVREIGKQFKKVQFSAYQLCFFKAILHIQDWANEKEDVDRIDYFFESGHKISMEMFDIFEALRQISHPLFIKLGPIAFPKKCEEMPLQIADYLAPLIQKFPHVFTLKEPREDIFKFQAAFFAKTNWIFPIMEEMSIKGLFEQYSKFRYMKRQTVRSSFSKRNP